MPNTAKYFKGTPWDELFNSVNFDNLLHIKLYSVLILKKIQKHRKKNNFKALKTNTLVLFPVRILSCKQDAPHLRRHDKSNHLVTSIAAALNHVN